jgi:hypothetical protein
MRRTRVIGVDPGKVTGLAFFIPNPEPSQVEFESLELPAAEAAQQVATWLALNLGGYPGVVAVERFTTGRQTGRQTAQPDALQVIGEVTAVGRGCGCTITQQSGNSAKRVGNNMRLTLLGWSRRTKDRHADDAAAHVLLALATYERPVFERVIARTLMSKTT